MYATSGRTRLDEGGIENARGPRQVELCPGSAGDVGILVCVPVAPTLGAERVDGPPARQEHPAKGRGEAVVEGGYVITVETAKEKRVVPWSATIRALAAIEEAVKCWENYSDEVDPLSGSDDEDILREESLIAGEVAYLMQGAHSDITQSMKDFLCDSYITFSDEEIEELDSS